ncbi:MAG: hypothetical protein J1F39_03190 [Clostridiales bacterium]|nr:hypothetical protein [Clostridiales bacterium]
MAEKKKKFGVIFVCTGNTCRSPMAEFMFKAYLKEKGALSDYAVSSAGLYARRGDTLSENADKALAFLGVNHTQKKARIFTAGMALDSDLVVAMSERHAIECGEVNNICTFEDIGAITPISDPYGGSLQDYLNCAAQMRACFDSLYALCEKIRNGK